MKRGTFRHRSWNAADENLLGFEVISLRRALGNGPLNLDLNDTKGSKWRVRFEKTTTEKEYRKEKKKQYLLAVDDVVLLNDLVNDGGIGVGDEAESPWPTRVTVFHYNGVRYLPVLLKVLHERLC